MQIASIDGNQVKVSRWQAAGIAALLGGSVLVGTTLAEFAIDFLNVGTEARKVALDERKASAELYRAALAVPEANERKEIVLFLLKAKLVDENLAVAEMTQFPHWPSE